MITVYAIAAQAAYNFGYTISSYTLAPFIRWIAPTWWETIGGTLNQILENWGIDLSSAPNDDAAVAQTGQMQAEVAAAVEMPASEQALVAETGADFGAYAPMSYEMYDYPELSWDSAQYSFGDGYNQGCTYGFNPEVCSSP